MVKKKSKKLSDLNVLPQDNILTEDKQGKKKDRVKRWLKIKRSKKKFFKTVEKKGNNNLQGGEKLAENIKVKPGTNKPKKW